MRPAMKPTNLDSIKVGSIKVGSINERSATCVAAGPAGSGNLSAVLDALSAAIAEAIEALAAWDFTAFESAVERQRSLCDRIASGEWCGGPQDTATASRIQRLNRIYRCLLRHSMHWTRIQRTIFEAGHGLPGRASMHFRG
jgi:hypothetical protein